ncbi:MAG: cytochrome c3 family protein [Pseudomonadota bacterium]
MGKKVYIALAALALTVGFFWSAVVMAQGHVTLSLAAQGLSERAPVEFDHESHLAALGDESCGQCHHALHGGGLGYEPGDEEKACADCHKVEAVGKRPALMRAYHSNCEGCHARDRKSYKETGPVTCGGCHVRATH